MQTTPREPSANAQEISADSLGLTDTEWAEVWRRYGGQRAGAIDTRALYALVDDVKAGRRAE